MIQLQFLNRLLDTKDASIFLINNITDEFFSSYKDEFNYIKNHLDTYGVIPDKASFLTRFPNFESIVVTEPDSYLLDELYKDKNSRFLAETFTKVRDKVLTGDVDEAMSLYVNAASDLSKAKHMESIDILQNTKQRYDAFVDKIDNQTAHYIKTGLTELDAIIGGWDRNEEYATIVARTNQGKSWMLLKFVTAALQQGLRVGIYSGEMSDNKVAYRLDTLIDHISNSALVKGGEYGAKVLLKYQDFLQRLPHMFPNAVCKVLTPPMIGGPAGVTTLRAFIEKENLDVLFIDQHSLLEDDRHAKNPVEKASNISKDLKNLQVLKKIPIITVSQQNRASTENGVGTEHVAQSDRIAQDSTIILFFEQKEIDSDSDINGHGRDGSFYSKFIKLSLVKSRDSVNMKDLKYYFDFDKGKFEYIPEKDSAEAQAKKDYYDNPTAVTDSINDCGENVF